MFTPIFTRRFRRSYRRLTPDLKRRVTEVIEEILSNPYRGKHLKGDLYCLWSWRIGKLRIIYSINEENRKIIFHIVEFREEVY